jgi:hypothetical protein
MQGLTVPRYTNDLSEVNKTPIHNLPGSPARTGDLRAQVLCVQFPAGARTLAVLCAVGFWQVHSYQQQQQNTNGNKHEDSTE